MNETGGIEELYYTEVGVGYITMIGEALAKGPIPYAFPGSNVFEYPTDPKTGTPIFPLAYGYDPGNFSGIGSLFANWTVDVSEHKLYVTLQPVPKPEWGVPVPFAGVIYPEANSLWIPHHYTGTNETYQPLSGDSLLISMTPKLGPLFPEGLSVIEFSMFIGFMEFFGVIWSNQPANLQEFNPMFPDKEVPAAVNL